MKIFLLGLIVALATSASANPGNTTLDDATLDDATPPTNEPSVRPGVNDKYLAPSLDVDTWVERFEGESRQIFRARGAILDALKIEPGMRIGDIGAGTGLFVRPLAARVGQKGKVYAVEISPRFVDHLKKKSAEEGLDQVEVVTSTARSAELSANSIDLAFICDVYHHFEYPKSMLASLHSALRIGGTLVIIDFKRIPGESKDWVLDHVRDGQEIFTREVLDAGFELESVVPVDGLDDNYMLRFRRP